MDRYPEERLPRGDDDGTMPANVSELSENVVGHRIVSVDREMHRTSYVGDWPELIITLDNGKRVSLVDSEDCCAYTSLNAFLLHPDMVDHVITGVGTTDGFTRWHIYADMGDVLELEVSWSPGNPFYYGYGFGILVEPLATSENGNEGSTLHASGNPSGLQGPMTPGVTPIWV